MLASVIVPTHCRFKTFQRCITSLFDQSVKSSDYEVIAVHDGEDHDYDLTSLSEKYPNFRFLTIPKSGASEARNRAIAECQGDYVLMTDDDCVASPTWIEMLTAFMQDHPELSAAGGQVLAVEPENFIQEYIKFKNLLRRPVKNIRGEVVTLITANVCYRRDVLQKIGGFSRRFAECGIPFGGEDLDLAFRAKKLGGLGYCEDAIVYHHHRSTLKALAMQHFMYGRGVYVACCDNNIPYKELRFAKPTLFNVVRHMFISTGRLLTISIPEYRQKGLSFWKYLPYFGLDLLRRDIFMIGATYEHYRQKGIH